LYANVSINATCVAPVAITKTVVTPADPTAQLSSGESVQYTVAVSNTSSANVSAAGVQVSDPVPTGIDATTVTWSCDSTKATGGATCPAAPNDSGTGDLTSTIASLPPGGGLTYTVSGQAATGVSGTVTNTASVNGTGLVCADGGPLPCVDKKSIPFAEADMQGSGTSTGATVGTPVTVTLTCTNAGPDTAVNATCVVTPPAGLTVSTVCSPTPPAASLALGQSITCKATFTPTDTTPVTLTVTAGSDTPDPDRANDAGTATVTPVAALIAPIAASVPTLGEMALLLLAALLGLSAVAAHRRGR
jgi:uncharacterized repeat protein (TIGR01451 family)